MSCVLESIWPVKMDGYKEDNMKGIRILKNETNWMTTAREFRQITEDVNKIHEKA
jgi:hypothetical protein